MKRLKFLLRGLLFSGCSLGLVACGGFPQTHPDPAKNTPANYKTDMQDCSQAYPETPDGVYLKRRIECLEMKGWR